MRSQSRLSLCIAFTGLGAMIPLMAGETPEGDGLGPKDGRGAMASSQGLPDVKRAVIRWIEERPGDGNARLQVEFTVRPSAQSIEIDFDGRPVTLRDDGEGRFSAVVDIDFDELQETLKAQEDFPGEIGEKRGPRFADFEGRQVVRSRERPAIEASQFKSGLEIDLSTLPGLPSRIDPKKSLMITDLTVVEDPKRTFNPCTGKGNPRGVWTFGHMMTVLANQGQTHIDPSDFARRWLASWEHDQAISNFTVEKRTGIREVIINPWEAASGGPGRPLDLSRAPFRLLAIVNRVDLRDNLLFEVPPAALLLNSASRAAAQFQFPKVVFRESNAGEARMVFGAIDIRKGPHCGDKFPFTVIFEFGISKPNCHELQGWARQWYHLKDHPLPSPAYNRALQRITDQFIKPAPDPAKNPRPNGLNQLRTNEIKLVLPPAPPPPPQMGPLWELREFKVAQEDSDKGFLRGVTVKQTPNNAVPRSNPEDLNDKAVIADFINNPANTSKIVLNSHIVPLGFPGVQPFLGARSLTLSPAFFWNGPPSPGPSISNRDARHHFSLNTCNGCHGGETKTPAFVMVSPTDVEADGSAKLAPFLTGVDVPDPADGAPTRHFDDLLRRRQDLDRLANFPCIFELIHRPLRMTH